MEPWPRFVLLDCRRSDDRSACRSAIRHLILPASVPGTHPLAVVARMTRSAMLEVLNEDDITSAPTALGATRCSG